MSSERRDEIFNRRNATTPARYDEGTLATNHYAATGERGYHNIDQVPGIISFVGREKISVLCA